MRAIPAEVFVPFVVKFSIVELMLMLPAPIQTKAAALMGTVRLTNREQFVTFMLTNPLKLEIAN